MAEIAFYLHKDVRAAGIRFYLHKEFLKKNNEKAILFSKNFRAARANLFRISVQFLKKNQEKLMIYFSMGAMRLKMMIFKQGNSVYGVALFISVTIFKKRHNVCRLCFVFSWRRATSMED